MFPTKTLSSQRKICVLSAFVGNNVYLRATVQYKQVVTTFLK